MKRLLTYITLNWKLKLLSLMLAIVIWFIVFFIGEMKKEVSVPITMVNLGKEYVIVRTDAEKVGITLAGRVSILKDVRDNDVKISLNLSNAKEGTNIFNLSRNNVEIPKGVQIGQIKPSSVRIDLDRIVEKQLKTVVELDKKISRRYAVKAWSPGRITVQGPKRVWGTRTSIKTNPVTGDFKREEETVTVTLDMEGLPVNKVEPNTVKVVLRRQSGKETIWY